MGGHNMLQASAIAREIGLERERQMMIRHRRSQAKAARPNQISELTWFGGIKATARFLLDAAREGISQQRLTEVRS